MLTIIDGGSRARILTLPIDLRLKRLLMKRRDQLGGDIKDSARFIVIEPGDRMEAFERELGWSILTTLEGQCFGDPDYYPTWEWLADHGHCFELVYIFTDDGFAHVVLIEKALGVDPDLLKLCEQYATAEV